MALKQGDKANFRTLLRAARAGHLGLVETTDKATGEYRALLCAIVWDGEHYQVTPFGHMVTGDPNDIYTDPGAELDKGAADAFGIPAGNT